jgi:hypothetical protein
VGSRVPIKPCISSSKHRTSASERAPMQTPTLLVRAS